MYFTAWVSLQAAPSLRQTMLPQSVAQQTRQISRHSEVMQRFQWRFPH